MSFTCAIHLEITNSVETDSFLLALRTFIGLRKNIRQMRSDNGNNFVSTVKELRKTFREMDHAQIRYLQILNADWMIWLRNPPATSHMGGVWEIKIRTARSILNALIKTHGKS